MELAVAQTKISANAAAVRGRVHNAAAPRISRRKFLALAAVSVETAKNDASVCFATLDTIDFVDDALESYGPVDIPSSHIPKRL
jgi:hypothetical protein